MINGEQHDCLLLFRQVARDRAIANAARARMLGAIHRLVVEHHPLKLGQQVKILCQWASEAHKGKVIDRSLERQGERWWWLADVEFYGGVYEWKQPVVDNTFPFDEIHTGEC